MFTEGLDSNALKWVREETAARKRHVPDAAGNQRNGGWGFGLPSQAKFQSGHLPYRSMPVVRASAVIPSESEYGPDEDSSEDERYGGGFSLDSSPQDDKLANGASARCVAPLQGHVKQGHGVQGLEGKGVGHSVGLLESTDDESSDSTAEISSTQTNGGGRAVWRAMYPSDGYCSNVGFQATMEMAAKQDFSGGLQNKKLCDNDIPRTPSAPPFVGSCEETNGVAEQVPTSRSHGVNAQNSNGNRTFDASTRISADTETAASSSVPLRTPTFHASGQGPWCAVISYDACVRLCLHSWAKGCTEAPIFLDNECALLRNAFGLQQVLLQPEEELLATQSSEVVSERSAPKPKKSIGKMKVQVRKVKMDLDPPTGCSFTSLKTRKQKIEFLQFHASNLKSTLSSRWEALRKVRVTTQIPANGSCSRQGLAYFYLVTEYIKEAYNVTTMRNSSTSHEVVPETYSCLLRLKSSSEEDAVRMQPGSGQTHVFFPDSHKDDLIIEVYDSKRKFVGRVIAQVAAIADDPVDKFRFWPLHHEPEDERIGEVQLYINYSTTPDENSHLKCGTVAETVAYDLVLEVAMKVQHFRQRNLLLYDPWKWLLSEFASYYGVSDAYAKLRYLSYVMDVATPTADCLILVHDFLFPVLMKDGNNKRTLSHQENRILGEIVDQVEQTLALVFENYKSLDESSPSGLMDIFKPATGLAAPALAPAIKLYSLLHDIISPEAQLKLVRYFQAAAKKRSRKHVAETDEFFSSKNENILLDSVTHSTAYQKMKSVCLSIRHEIFTDIEIHNQNILPSFIDLPNLSSPIYSLDLCSRIRAFLVACPPSGPSPPVVELVIATADLQRDLASWKINHVKGGVDAKELFHSYISLWIQEKCTASLETCKLEKVKWSGIKTKHSTTPFVDDMYDRLMETMNEYEVIISRWPEYIFPLENVLADIEKAVVEALDKQYADVLSPLKENLTNKVFGLKYVQKIARGTIVHYTVPDELAVFLNSMRRMIDVLRPKIETRLKLWGSFIPNGGNAVPGEHLSEVTVMLRAKFRKYRQAVVEKLAENTRIQNATTLKKIIKDSNVTVVESDFRSRMQPLKELLTSTLDHLHSVFEADVFIAICRGFWDRMGQDLLSFLESRREKGSCYKGSRIAVSILDDIFASQMQQLLGNALQQKDLEPPRSITDVHSVLCKDAHKHGDDSNYYY
ncbi:uncharacterized protein LOC131151657 isoform X2 [Malania oleifera]|uniref:uncharacterized protein LOC131151657 isoform X2 n=1 Tax=Malania oleifera TaxID=397392 RepID=UPI0025AE2A74|nr:uncharacterized protein LOC131151657 isoform X2 [Malania oleifera]